MHERGRVVMTPFRVGLNSGEVSACQVWQLANPVAGLK